MTTRSLRTPKVFGFLALVAIALLFVIPLLAGASSSQATAALQSEVKSTSSPTPTPTASADCEAEFVQVELKHEGNKVDSDFEKDYVEATAPDVANLSDAAKDLLLKKAGQNAHFLAIRASELGLYEGPNDWKGLVDNGCLSKEGQKLHAQYEGVLSAEGTVFTEEDAPATAINSGVHNGVYGVANSGGIYGDLRAIKITLKDGTSVYILIRCANGVFPSNPGLPEVPTDNPPPPRICPPELPYGEFPNCKDSPAQDPGPRGNAPEGNGPNDDPGPGTYIPPGNMEQPPTTPRVDPPPPPPVPPTPTQPTTPVPTQDPTPPPPKEPEAPKPEEPETTCDASVPGVVC